jgi:hypothetical protein
MKINTHVFLRNTAFKFIGWQIKLETKEQWCQAFKLKNKKKTDEYHQI